MNDNAALCSNETLNTANVLRGSNAALNTPGIGGASPLRVGRRNDDQQQVS